MDEFLKRLGKRIRFLRKRRGYTQIELADAIGLNYVHYGDIERGKCNASILTLKKVADGLGVEMYELFLFTQDRERFEYGEDLFDMLILLVREKDDQKLDAAKTLLDKIINIGKRD